MKRMYAKDTGERIYRQLTVKVFTPGNERHSIQRYTAPAKQGFDFDGIQKTLNQLIEQVERRHPDHVFRLVELQPNVFNIVWECLATPSFRRETVQNESIRSDMGAPQEVLEATTPQESPVEA